jgi:predicted unusual protein kinase regulating ubiquinone biosynthesis (AarF/ABC1/UbiB family)
MMDELPRNVKSGLVNIIFGIYENDSKEVCNAMEEMGILKQNIDRFSIEKIVRVILKQFNEGIQSKDTKWINELPKEEQIRLQKQQRLQLANEIFTLKKDVPFKFPPSFTFVVRAFTSLDGIGKGLDKEYDLTRLAQPYVKELVDLRDGSASLSLLKSALKSVRLRPEDIQKCIQQPQNIAYLYEVINKLEQGDLQLRVRVIESEKSFERLKLEQSKMMSYITFFGILQTYFFLNIFSSFSILLRTSSATLLATAPELPASTIMKWITTSSPFANSFFISTLSKQIILWIVAFAGLNVIMKSLQMKSFEKEFNTSVDNE